MLNSNRIIRILPHLILFLFSSQLAAEDWICTEAASIRQGDSYLVCGVASAENEGDAREKALIRAKKEFKLICYESLDCRGRPTRVDPLRNTCESTGKNQVKCYRGLRYTFMDDEGGLFGRSTPVSAMGSTRPDIIKPYTFGVAYYQQSYNVTVKSTDPQQQAEPLLTDSYGGIAGFFSIAFNHRYGINTSAYWLNNIDHTNQSKAGGEAQFIVGTNLNQSGFKVLGGVGGFYETWASGDLNAEFYGAQLVLGLGYHARSTSYDFMINMRQTKTYDDHAFSSDVSNVNTSAAGAAFRFGLRF